VKETVKKQRIALLPTRPSTNDGRLRLSPSPLLTGGTAPDLLDQPPRASSSRSTPTISFVRGATGPGTISSVAALPVRSISYHMHLPRCLGGLRDVLRRSSEPHGGQSYASQKDSWSDAAVQLPQILVHAEETCNNTGEMHQRPPCLALRR
jgi:hypothetical protein